MSRRYYLITYDICDDKRRNKIFSLLEGEGDHAQFSVFLCDLSRAELASTRTQICDIINQREDQVLILDLGTNENPINNGLEVLGTPYDPLTRTIVV